MACIESITVTPSYINIKVGEWYYGAHAQIYPSTACGGVFWESGNTSVASVNSSMGYIYGKSAGTTRIYATATDGYGASDYCTVTVSQTIPVESITLNRTSLSLQKGNSYTLSATVCPTNATKKTLTWTSSNTSVATVSGGVVYAKSTGSATITASATDDSGVKAYCYVTVTGDTLVTSVTVSPSSKTMKVGDSAYLYETVCPENATKKVVKWSSSDECVATVNPTSGLVIAHNAGTARIYATAQDGSGKQGYCTVTVSQTISVESITLNRTSLSLKKGNSYTLSATVCPTNATKKTLTWTSSNECVATVSGGVVYAKSTGSATITASATDGSGVKAYCYVTVTGDTLVTSVTVSPSSMTMTIGQSVYLYETVCPENATNKDVAWTSSDSAIVTVDKDSGFITARGEGTARIYATATDGSGIRGSSFITVNSSVSVTSVKVCPISKTMNAGESTYLTAIIYPDNASNKNVTWSSSDKSVATVKSTSGLVIAQGPGTAVITATSTDGSGKSASSIVAVNDVESTITRSKYGSVEYNGEVYDIFVPNHLGTSIDAVWTTVDTIYITDPEFDLCKFIAGIDMPSEETGHYAPGNFRGELNRSILVNSGMKAPIGVASFFAGVLNSANESINNTFVKFNFQETSDGQKRVIIKAGSNSIERAFSTYANDIPISAYYNNSGAGLIQARITNSVGDLYEELTGEERNIFTIYDCEVTIDKRHKNDDGAASYLWVNKNGEIMETAIIYSNDKVQFGKRKGFWVFSQLDPFARVELSGSSVAASKYQELFYKLG